MPRLAIRPGGSGDELVRRTAGTRRRQQLVLAPGRATIGRSESTVMPDRRAPGADAARIPGMDRGAEDAGDPAGGWVGERQDQPLPPRRRPLLGIDPEIGRAHV